MKTPTILCWSGGKDSAMTLYELQQGDEFEVVALLTTVTRDYDRISMHGVRRTLLAQQARSLGIPLREVFISPGASNDEYEWQMRSLLEEFRQQGVQHVAFGDIFLEDLREYRIRQLQQVDMLAHFPIWKRDTTELVNTFIDLGFRAMTSCIDPRKLTPEFAGREIDRTFVAELPEDVDPCGENGEFHSFIFDGPNLLSKIRVSRGEVVERDGFLFCDLLPRTTAATQDALAG